MKRFCLLTTGRAASTGLIKALGAYPDIAVPSRNIESGDEELLSISPEKLEHNASIYAELTGRPIVTAEDLIEAFYSHNAASAYAGFKSMPNRHSDFDGFVRRSDIRFIVLTRDDVASTVASFFVAVRTGSWRRDGGLQHALWTFGRDHAAQVVGHLKYVLEERQRLLRLTQAIQISYEALCSENFSSPELDEYFARPIRLSLPRTPVHAQSYVTNWDVYVRFINEQRAKLEPAGRV